MKIKIEYLLLFTLPLGYFFPSLAWITWASVWLSVVFIWGGVFMVLYKYNSMVEGIRTARDETGVIPTAIQVGWKGLLVAMSLFTAMYLLGWQAAGVLCATGWIALVCAVRDMIKDSGKGA